MKIHFSLLMMIFSILVYSGEDTAYKPKRLPYYVQALKWLAAGKVISEKYANVHVKRCERYCKERIIVIDLRTKRPVLYPHLKPSDSAFSAFYCEASVPYFPYAHKPEAASETDDSQVDEASSHKTSASGIISFPSSISYNPLTSSTKDTPAALLEGSNKMLEKKLAIYTRLASTRLKLSEISDSPLTRNRDLATKHIHQQIFALEMEIARRKTCKAKLI